jgi:hypothetical protein
MKLVLVKFTKEGNGFLFLGEDSLGLNSAVFCRRKEGIFAGKVVQIPPEEVLAKDTDAYLPLKECVGVKDDISYELWRQVKNSQKTGG